jgi:pimeloyl-ACP methyl ester carboxylesterase
MKNNYLWTKSKARLQLFRAARSGENYNWLFLPGGPGLGSESLVDLVAILDLPGTMWLADLPGDGSNTTDDDASSFSHWSDALLEITSALENVILVAHSSGGMFALATPGLEQNLIGLVLADTAPNANWQMPFVEYVSAHPLAEAEKLQTHYNENPSNDVLKKLTIACAPYFSTKKSSDKIIARLGLLPFNYKSHRWAAVNFRPTYQAKWIPQHIPTMIFAGDQDHITPLKLFSDSPDFKRKNIHLVEVNGAGHFPWLDEPEKIKSLFNTYCERLP